MNLNLRSRFNSAFAVVQNNSEMLADYYISEYWDESNNTWNWELINESVVREIEKDSQQLSSL